MLTMLNILTSLVGHIGVHSSRGLGGVEACTKFMMCGTTTQSRSNLNIHLTKGLSGLLVDQLNRWAPGQLLLRLNQWTSL